MNIYNKMLKYVNISKAPNYRRDYIDDYVMFSHVDNNTVRIASYNSRDLSYVIYNFCDPNLEKIDGLYDFIEYESQKMVNDGTYSAAKAMAVFIAGIYIHQGLSEDELTALFMPVIRVADIAYNSGDKDSAIRIYSILNNLISNNDIKNILKDAIDKFEIDDIYSSYHEFVHGFATNISSGYYSCFISQFPKLYVYLKGEWSNEESIYDDNSIKRIIGANLRTWWDYRNMMLDAVKNNDYAFALDALSIFEFNTGKMNVFDSADEENYTISFVLKDAIYNVIDYVNDNEYRNHLERILNELDGLDVSYVDDKLFKKLLPSSRWFYWARHASTSESRFKFANLYAIKLYDRFGIKARTAVTLEKEYDVDISELYDEVVNKGLSDLSGFNEEELAYMIE